MVYFLKYIKWEIMFPAVVGVLTIRQTKCLVKKKIPVFLERNKTKQKTTTDHENISSFSFYWNTHSTPVSTPYLSPKTLWALLWTIKIRKSYMAEEVGFSPKGLQNEINVNTSPKSHDKNSTQEYDGLQNLT